jgi:hypothetical protein
MKYQKGYEPFVFTVASQYEEYKNLGFSCVVKFLSVEAKARRADTTPYACP